MSTQPGHDARLIGLHLPLGGGLLKAADRASVIGARTIQVFTDNPTAWRRRSGLPAQLAEFRARLAGHGIGPIAVHAPYLVNLAGAYVLVPINPRAAGRPGIVEVDHDQPIAEQLMRPLRQHVHCLGSVEPIAVGPQVSGVEADPDALDWRAKAIGWS